MRRIRSPGGVVLRGEAGVGKSRLVEETIAELRPSAWVAHRFVGASAAREIPFGALFELLPTDRAMGPAQLLAEVERRLLEGAQGRRLVLVLDDVAWFDDTSLLLVAGLVRRSRAVALLTARSTDDLPESIDGLLTEGLLEQWLVEPLDQPHTGALLEQLVGAPVTPPIVDDLHGRSGGNPLLLRELVFDALENGAIGVCDGSAVLTGPLHPGIRVQQTVLARTQRLSAPAQELLGWLAVSGGLDLSILDRDEHEAVGELERHGFLAVDGRSGQIVARPGHALIAEAIAESMPTHRRGATLQLLANRIADAADPSPGMALRAAEWLRSLDIDPPPALAERALVEGMRCLALDLSDWIARRALDVRDRPEILLQLADINRLGARIDRALDLLDRLEPTLSSDDLRAYATEIRAKILSHHHGRADEAAALLEAAARDLHDPALRKRLRVMAQGLGGHLGSFDEVLAETGRRLRRPSHDPKDTFWTQYFHIFAGAMTGRSAGAEGVIDDALTLAPSVDDAGDDVVDVLWSMRSFVHAQRGTLRLGRRETQARIETCDAAQTTNICTSTFFLPLLWHAGDLGGVRHHAERVLLGDAGPDSWGIAPIATSMTLRAALLTGDDDGARTLLRALPDQGGDERTAPFVTIGRVSALRSEGQFEDAAKLAREAVRRATDTTHGSFAVWVLRASLDAADPDGAADLVDAAPTDVDGPLLLTMLRHARAVAAQDVEALASVVTDYQRSGAHLDAADAALHAAVVADPSTVQARRWVARGILLASRIDGARFSIPEVPDALSPKELEVAAMALSMPSNRDIADSLVVSKRTVDNHLYRCYRKLDVGSRAELSAVLEPG